MFRGLTDYPPRGLTQAQRQQWERTYVQSEAIAAKGVWGKDGSDWPAHVATKVHRDLRTPSGRPRALPRPGILPNPGDMIGIGFAVDVQYYDDASKRIETTTFPLPVCLWSERLQAVVIFRRMAIPEANIAAQSMPQMLALFRRWHDGKMPKAGGSELVYHAPFFTAVYPCVAETYRSDKFDDDYEYVDYVHHNDPGPSGQHGPLLYLGPDCAMIRGGRLALTSRGLIH